MSKKAKEQSYYVLIRPNGEFVEEKIDKLSLEKAQELVGGLVQVVPRFTTFKEQPCVALCDEEGKMKQYDYNNRATLEWKASAGSIGLDRLVGNVVVIVGPARRSWG